MEILALGVVLCYSRLSFQRVDYDNGSRATSQVRLNILAIIKFPTDNLLIDKILH